MKMNVNADALLGIACDKVKGPGEMSYVNVAYECLIRENHDKVLDSAQNKLCQSGMA